MARISWQTELDCTQTCARPSLKNAVTVLRLDPIWRSGRLWYDEFLDRVLIANSPVREWTDRDDSRVALYMQGDEINMRTVTSGMVREAVYVVAEERTRHCVRDWLTSLTWDGEERIAHAFEDHWGAPLNDLQPVDYIRSVSENFFIGLVARVFRPGCQLDTMVVFEGEQGLKKSSALRLLAGEWYASAHESVQKKDFFEAMRGKWIIEISEMDAFKHAEITRIKSVISTPTDRYRPSYGRASRDFDRQCIFAGTTNKYNWGEDETGLRRFWPLRCGDINLVSLGSARDQLCAEAVSKYKSGASWWNVPGSSKDVQAERQYQDVWTGDVLEWANSQVNVEIRNALKVGLKKDIEKCGRSDEMRVARILTLAGWKQNRNSVNGVRVRLWARSNESSEVF